MTKKIYLKKTEQEVFNALVGSGISIATNEQIKGLFRYSAGKINKACSGLLKKGYLFKLKRGLYLVQREPSKKPLIDDPLKIASSLEKGYVGFSSALKVYGLTEYEPFTVFFVTNSKSYELKLGEYTLKMVNMGKRATGESFAGDFYVSSIEKTFFDCFYKPQYAGGYSEIARALYSRGSVDWDSFIAYFEMFASDSLCQRTGYILDMLAKNTDFRIPKKVIDYFERRISTKTRLMPGKKESGKYSNKWKVLDNAGINNILSWWS